MNSLLAEHDDCNGFVTEPGTCSEDMRTTHREDSCEYDEQSNRLRAVR